MSPNSITESDLGSLRSSEPNRDMQEKYFCEFLGPDADLIVTQVPSLWITAEKNLSRICMSYSKTYFLILPYGAHTFCSTSQLWIKEQNPPNIRKWWKIQRGMMKWSKKPLTCRYYCEKGPDVVGQKITIQPSHLQILEFSAFRVLLKMLNHNDQRGCQQVILFALWEHYIALKEPQLCTRVIILLNIANSFLWRKAARTFISVLCCKCP